LIKLGNNISYLIANIVIEMSADSTAADSTGVTTAIDLTKQGLSPVDLHLDQVEVYNKGDIEFSASQMGPFYNSEENKLLIKMVIPNNHRFTHVELSIENLKPKSVYSLNPNQTVCQLLIRPSPNAPITSLVSGQILKFSFQLIGLPTQSGRQPTIQDQFEVKLTDRPPFQEVMDRVDAAGAMNIMANSGSTSLTPTVPEYQFTVVSGSVSNRLTAVYFTIKVDRCPENTFLVINMQPEGTVRNYRLMVLRQGTRGHTYKDSNFPVKAGETYHLRAAARDQGGVTIRWKEGDRLFFRLKNSNNFFRGDKVEVTCPPPYNRAPPMGSSSPHLPLDQPVAAQVTAAGEASTSKRSIDQISSGPSTGSLPIAKRAPPQPVDSAGFGLKSAREIQSFQHNQLRIMQSKLNQINLNIHALKVQKVSMEAAISVLSRHHQNCPLQQKK
jgi:hypothetical protein